jgi:SAM-dependent methyltransferase
MEGIMASFYELYGDISLKALLSNWQPEAIRMEEGEWLHFPPKSFLSWATAFPRYDFDANPNVPYPARMPTFLLSQTHRLWLSAELVVDHCGLAGDLVDFGSFPFAVPLILRDYFRYQGSIVGTAIQPLSDESKAILNQFRIQLEMLDLDPYVRDRSRVDNLPLSLTREAQSVDVVTMFHVIEHLYHPIPALREAYRILRKGGHLIITTDNAMMLNVLVNYLGGYGYVFEPVEITSSMLVHDWRGHVRFFTADDLRTMTTAAGFIEVEAGFEQIFYDVFHEAYLQDPAPYLPGWQQTILKKHRQFANDVYYIASKS